MAPKPHELEKMRLIQNYSFPRVPRDHHFSINYFINSDDFPCTWGTFNAMCLKISMLPPGSQMGVRDMSEAFRLILPSGWGLSSVFLLIFSISLSAQNWRAWEICLRQIPASVLGRLPAPAPTGMSETRWQTFCGAAELAQLVNGSMTPLSSAYSESTSPSTTRSELLYIGAFPLQVAVTKQADAYGGAVARLPDGRVEEYDDLPHSRPVWEQSSQCNRLTVLLQLRRHRPRL